ncbi:C-type lectin domain family 6 member A-like isoform X2 [Channa argus]|uniref:C-type lectin domain family 6 member A-like isoform X2 n=1 Tax=Channa argus TaxID=215402 RepID=UPI00352099CF
MFQFFINPTDGHTAGKCLKLRFYIPMSGSRERGEMAKSFGQICKTFAMHLKAVCFCVGEATSSSEETTYSEIKILKTQPPAEQPASQQVESNKRSKVTSDRVPLLVLSVLLTAAVIGLCVVCFDHFKTKKKLEQTVKENNETMMKTFQTLKNENKGIKKNLTECLSEINQCTRLQPMCPEPTEVNTNEPCQKCEEGWELHGGKCYYFSNKPSSWKQSREECVRHGGDLVKIDSREEQSFLVKRLTNKMNEHEDRFWIGLTDSEKEGRWLWVDRSELNTSLSFWKSGEPDDWKGKSRENPDGEDCVRMGYKERADDLKCWFDQFCNNPHKSICEKAAQTGRYVCNCSL